jgi:hypothetical protein
MNGRTHNPGLDLLHQWNRRAQGAQRYHDATARRLGSRHYMLGIPAVVLSTIVGTSVFAALGKQVDQRLQIGVGVVSVLAAVLTALQTFLRLAERGEQHRVAAGGYAALRRDIEVMEFEASIAGTVTLERIQELQARLDALLKQSPDIAFTPLPVNERMEYDREFRSPAVSRLMYDRLRTRPSPPLPPESPPVPPESPPVPPERDDRLTAP